MQPAISVIHLSHRVQSAKARASPLAGKTIAEGELGKRFGVTVLAVRREGEILSIPPADLALEPEDILFIVGPPANLADLEAVLRGPAGRGTPPGAEKG